MIILEITDETGITHYEILGLKPAELAASDAKEAALKVRTAAKRAKKTYNKAAQRGNKEAEERLDRINQAENTLKSQEDRFEYDEQLGHSGNSEVFRVQPITSPFFMDRTARFRAIERMLHEASVGSPPD